MQPECDALVIRPFLIDPFLMIGPLSTYFRSPRQLEQAIFLEDGDNLYFPNSKKVKRNTNPDIHGRNFQVAGYVAGWIVDIL